MNAHSHFASARSARRGLAGLAVAAVVLAGAAVGAAPAAADPHEDLAANYTSLSASLIGFYAEKSNQSLGEYLDTQQVLLKPADLTSPGLGDPTGPDPSTDPALPDPETAGEEFDDIDVAEASAGGGLLLTGDQLGSLTGEVVPVHADSVSSLNEQLDSSGLTLSSKKFKNLASLAREVTRAARTPDGAVTLAAAAWARDLSALRAPGLGMPGTPGAKAPGVPADALPLGLLMNQSLTNMVLNHPNLIAQAQNSHGLGSPALVKAWNSSMAQAYADSEGDLTAMLPNPCVGEMMGVMATGDPKRASGRCSNACAVAGQYLHYQSGAAFDASQNSFSSNAANPAGGVLNHATFSNMASWAQGMVAAQNPTLTGSGALTTPGNGFSDCTSASKGAKNTLGNKLPGMFAGLR